MQLDVLVSRGKFNFGGNNLAHPLELWLVEDYKNTCYVELRDHSEALQRLYKACREIKANRAVQSSARSSQCVRVHIPNFIGNKDYLRRVPPDEMERVFSAPVKVISSIIRKALRDAGITATDIEAIVMVGAKSNIPEAAQLLHTLFPEKQVLQDASPGESIACGAAIHAAHLMEDLSRREAETSVQDETFGATCIYRYGNSDYIGGGQFGSVYRAAIVSRGNFNGSPLVAVKVVKLKKEELEMYSRLRDRFSKLIGLKHDHLVTYHKVAITKALGGATVELMMDYYRDGDLSAYIKIIKEGKVFLSESIVIRYLLQIAEGALFLHQQGLIHWDLKPANVLVKRSDTETKILAICDLDDFVQMKRSDISCSNDITHIRGTIRFMSPEMIKKYVAICPTKSPGRSADIWSLGCVTLGLASLTQTHTFNKKWIVCPASGDKIEAGDDISDNRFMEKIVAGYVPFVSEDIPEHLAMCLRQCLSASSEDRITATDLIKQLKVSTSTS
ncbi:serine/threonine-protein kinase sepA-like [Paramacrobiotus metropolitanus]|uniref:serine/threonine-protein kinase sepA-like n=1 Tax=Paramacrobiotus metropolitanus TaxID=2943436 RepID=UPI0024458AE3|nr:serine/threonine-protein kinase sepA-like [Paramacrobiotus metropolitanus]